MRTRYSLSDAELNRWPVFAPVDGAAPAEPVALDRAVCVVGARVLVHLPLESHQVSKAHALIVQNVDGVYLRDLSSKNKTFVNGEPVCEARLETGYTVQFGPCKYRCHSGFDHRGEPIAMPLADLHLAPDGLASHRIVPVEHYTFLIGSRRGCDLEMSGAEISLAHAVMFVRDGHRFLRDLSSISGTFVNSQRIREVELHADDQIRIGAHDMIYHAPADTDDVPVDVLAWPVPLHSEEMDETPLPWDDDENVKVTFEGDDERAAARASSMHNV